MNNGKIIDIYEDDDVVSRVPFLEKRVGEVTGVLEAISGLQKSEHYRNLNKFLLKTRMDSLMSQLRGENDPIKLYRLQGKVDELDNFTDLNKLTQIYDNELKYLKGQIEIQKNAEKEN